MKVLLRKGEKLLITHDVIGLAPRGGKFNGATREMFGRLITDYKDQFVFMTCDVVCDDIASVAKVLQKKLPVSTGLSIISGYEKGTL